LTLHRVNDVDKPGDSIGVVLADSEEGRRDPRGDTDGVLGIEVGFDTGITFSLGVAAAVDAHGGEGVRVGEIGTEDLEEGLEEEG
jgi:hypothetical protein